jgi:thiol-disulfide isomerase/thioredoxin
VDNPGKMTPLLPGIVDIILRPLIFVFKNQGQGPGMESIAKVGEMAPDFKLPALGGKSVRLSDYRGKVVFLNIRASWCPPCREEMPSMEALSNRLKDRPFKMLAVSIDQQGEETVGPFIAQLGLNFPALRARRPGTLASPKLFYRAGVDGKT